MECIKTSRIVNIYLRERADGNRSKVSGCSIKCIGNEKFHDEIDSRGKFMNFRELRRTEILRLGRGSWPSQSLARRVREQVKSYPPILQTSFSQTLVLRERRGLLVFVDFGNVFGQMRAHTFELLRYPSSKLKQRYIAVTIPVLLALNSNGVLDINEE